MRYFHRTSVKPDDVIREAEEYFGNRLEKTQSESRFLDFQGTLGKVSVQVRAEGGHYTLITLSTDQVGESELDKFAKRFLSTIHTKVDPQHEVRGAY